MSNTKYIALLSDSHGMRSTLKSALDQLPENISLILHAGDVFEDSIFAQEYTGIETIGVRGNCDWSIQPPAEQLLDIAGHRILLTHGDIYRVKRTLDLLEQHAREENADICVYGHTHFADVERKENLLLVNPGSLVHPRGGGPSYGILSLDSTGADVKIYPLS